MSDKNKKNLKKIKASAAKTEKSAEATKTEIKIIRQNILDVQEYLKDPVLGINEETMMAFIGKRTWKIDDSANSKSIRDIIRNNYLAIVELITNQKTQIEILKNISTLDDHTKIILEAGLDNTFEYDIAAEDRAIGPSQLRYLAQELGHFLVVLGGKGGSKHSQMLQKLSQMNLLTD